MQVKGANRIYGLLHKDEPFHDGSFTRWAKEESPEFPFRYDDGVSIWMSEHDLTPDDDFLGNRPPSAS